MKGMKLLSVASLSVKDFVIDIQSVKEEVKKKKEQKKTQITTSYDIVLENNIDFVINRKTSTTDKNLVFLISQGTFYIQDNKSKDVDKVNEYNLRSFFQNIYTEKFDKFKKLEWWKSTTPKSMIDKMTTIVHSPVMQKMYQHGVIVDKYKVDSWKDAFENNVKLFRYCYEKTKTSRSNSSSLNNILKLATEIEKKINYNNATYFVDKFCESNVKMYMNEGYRNENYNKFFSLTDTYKLEFNRYIDYLCVDLYTQGIEQFDNSILTEYSDYLRMQVSLYGKVKEKYPKYLRTEHDIISLKVSLYERHKKDLMLLNVVDHYKELEFKDKEYCIVLPKSSLDIVDEGVAQSHCVASYVDQVARNETLIVFLRTIEEPEKSLVTVEVRNKAITQAKGFANRQITENETKFLKKWAKAKELTFTI